MELVITSQDLEPLPEKNENLVNKHLGFLNSNYQQVVRGNFNKKNSNSLFGIRQRLKGSQYSTDCSIETILKVSLFIITFLVVIF